MRVPTPTAPLTRRPGLLVVLAVTLLCASCTRSDRLAVHPVHGRVLFEGHPATEALVIFHPQAAGEEWALIRPSARVGPDGSFTLTTYDAGDGAPAGDYAVTIDWREHTAPVEGAPPGRSLLPPRYASPQTSPLHAQVKPGANELEPFKLTR